MDDVDIFSRAELQSNALLGPTKVALLQGIHETGSIAAAGRRIGITYKRAWYQVHRLNSILRTPLVTAARGGKSGGTAHLTLVGAAILDRYHHKEARERCEGDLHSSAA